MKRSHFWLLTALLVVSCGGDDGAGPGDDGGNNNPPPPTAQPTAEGTPDGAPTTQTIGAAGGSIASSDGAFTINIPAGALASDIDITVQPLTNTAWGGIGAGYQLTPDGLAFSQPVELVLQIAPEDLVGSAPETLDIAFQDDAGFWFVLKNRTYDDVSGTLTCTTTHFSSYAGVEGVQMRPPVATVGVNGNVNMSIEICYFEDISNDPNISAALLTCNSNVIYPASDWSVNGVRGGNSTVGRVATTSDANHAKYTAPGAVPLANPVALSAKISTGRGTLVLVSNITVFSGYTGTITHVDEAGNKEEYTLTWESKGALADIETFTGTGTLVYTPGDSGCNPISFTPNTSALDPQSTYMIVNRNLNPFQVTVTANAAWMVMDCYQCPSSPPECVEYLELVGFQDGTTGTISSDGNTITGYFVDLGSSEYWNYQFTR